MISTYKETSGLGGRITAFFQAETIYRQANEINRGTDMSAILLLNLSNKLRNSDKMRGLLSISLHFGNKFINKFNSTRTPMTVRFYLSYDIKITSKSHFWR